MWRKTGAGLGVFFSGILAACAHHATVVEVGGPPDGGTNAGTADSTFTMVTVCEHTACEAGAESNDCSACWTLAEVTMQQSGYSQATVDHCTQVCSGSPCSTTENTKCVDGYFVANVTSATDNALYAACIAFFHLDDGDAQRSSDETENDKQICAAWAKTERPEMAAYLACETAHDDVSACTAPPPTSLGDELCGGLTAACGPSEADDFFACDSNRASWNENGGELRDDAVKAGLSCLANDCKEIEACLVAWQQAIERGSVR